MEVNFRPIAGGTITSPKGFLAGATYAGIKANETLDLGILYAETSCVAGGMFTTNKIKAAPIILCQKHLMGKRAQAVVVNSGCANACTGEKGLANALEMAKLTAQRLGISPQEVLVASTGVIGIPLPMEHIRKGITTIALSYKGGHDLAKAIMSTDTFPKEIAIKIEGDDVAIGGIAKGAGMIHPNLATLLCLITTDAAVDGDFLQQALRNAMDASFNMITVDGDTSPNDTVLLLANGLSGRRIEGDTPEAKAFEHALEEVCLYLAQCVVKDAEGATKFIEVMVEGAFTREGARLAARTIASSPLVKAAVHGGDPNWGRIIAALGRSGAEVDETKIDLYLNKLCLVKSGCPLRFDVDEAKAILSNSEVPIRVCLNLGKESATAWGCDLSEEYVTINSKYMT